MDSHDSPDGPDWTSSLPDEVLELVLSGVPALDLAENARLVCRRWRRVLSGRALWRRVRVSVRADHEADACRVLCVVPALAELALFPEDGVQTRCAPLVLSAVRSSVHRVAVGELEVRSLSLDWRHFSADPASRACFHGILTALRDSVRHLDVVLYGVQPVDDPPQGASPQQPRPVPALSALAAMPAITSLRLRAMFDPCWYFDEMQRAAHTLRILDALGCESFLSRLLADLLETHGGSLEALAITARGLAAAVAVMATRDKILHLPALRRLIINLECQDAAVSLPEAVCVRLVRLELVGINRRLPPPGHDVPARAARSLEYRTWPALRSLVLVDCLVSPSDLATMLHTVGDRLDEIVFQHGLFLGSAETLASVLSKYQTRTRLVSRGLNLAPRDQATGLFPMALES